MSVQPVSYTLQDGKIRLIGIPLVSLLVPMLLHPADFQPLGRAGLEWWVTGFSSTILIWEGNRQLILQFRRLFSQYHQTTRRLVLAGICGLIYTFLASLVLDELICKLLLQKDILPFTGFQTSLMPTLLVYLVYESIYFFDAWKQHVRQTESLARESVQAQLDVLKTQLDPHFLFNSLNTLAALIDDENTDAQQYLERLADVYRYVLVSRGKNTVRLEEEMAFLEAYVYLNKIRFRDNLLVSTRLSPEAYGQFVTPLSLQILIENAIKHNVVSKEKPLTISIRQEPGDYVVVQNNIQQKTIMERSTRVGLQNIVNRYRLLTDRPVEIIRTDALFTVRIPLLLN